MEKLNELWKRLLICLFVLVLPGKAVIHCWDEHQYYFWRGVGDLLSYAFYHIIVVAIFALIYMLVNMIVYYFFLVDIDLDKILEKIDGPFGGEGKHKQGIITTGVAMWGWVFYLFALFPYAIGYFLRWIYPIF